MKIISMIPARYSASRFPAKLMQNLAGKTVILRTYEATVATQLFDEVYVVTDSDIIYNEIVNHGGKAIMSKKEHQSGSDRIAEAVEDLDVDIVVNVQGDEPFTERESLFKVLETFKDDHNKEIDLASLIFQIFHSLAYFFMPAPYPSPIFNFSNLHYAMRPLSAQLQPTP